MSTKKTIQGKLSREERNRIESAIARAKRDSKVPATAQQTIPNLRMHPDGICQASDALYTKTIQFQDINYQLAQNDDKTAIFD